MPHPSARPMTSAVALGAEPVQLAATPRMASPVAGDSASRAALDRLNAAVAELKALSIQPILQQAVAALQADDHKTGGDLAIKALEMDERNGFAWYLMAIARERAGDFGLSVKCYESALALIPDHDEIANDMGRLAYRMGMVDTAEKLFAHYLTSHPGSPEASNNLACALRDQRRFADAVEVLRPAIQADPDNALLWNTLGTVVGEQGDPRLSATFFDESLRVDPGMSRARYNRGNARLALGDPEGAFEDVEQAMPGAANEEERLMMQLARSTIQLARGRLAEGWNDYEVRLQPRFADATRFYIDRPQWTPDADVAGKSVLVFGEQGLGDELLFANTLPDLIEAIGPQGHLRVAVEKRLIPLFQRSFPTAEIGHHASFAIDGKILRGAPFVEDMSEIDLWAPIGSLLRRFRTSEAAFPQRERYLVPDPARVSYWREQLAALPGPKVGLLWKSMISNGARHRYFSPFEQWAAVLATPGVTFVNLQYGDCAAELEMARRDLGVEIWQPPGIDLKNDLDDVAALCCAMDLVIGFANATINLAGACGAPMWLITVVNAWTMLGADGYPWYPQARCFCSSDYQDWTPIMDEVAGALRERFAAGDGPAGR